MSILINEISYSINALIEAIGNMHCSWRVGADKLVSFNKFRFSTMRRLIINIKGFEQNSTGTDTEIMKLDISLFKSKR